MNLNEALLQKLSEWQPTSRQTLSLAWEGAPWLFHLTVDAGDAYSCRVWELTGRQDNPQKERIALKTWADSICRKATGLMESLRIVEIDEPGGSALLRSSEATTRGSRLEYYELLLKDSGEVLFHRYQKSHEPGMQRERIGFTLTHEAILRLLEAVIPVAA